MAKTMIRGVSQILPKSLTNVQLADDAAIQTSKLEDGSKLFFNDGTQAYGNGSTSAPMPLGGNRITGMADGSANNDAVTVQQLSAAVTTATTGLDAKAAVDLATPYGQNISLAGGVFNLDGKVVAAGMRILAKDQTDSTQNGIYTVPTNLNDPWVRSVDADSATPDAEMRAGTYVFVEKGTQCAATGWILTSSDEIITLGSSAIDFVQFTGLGQVVAGGGLTKTGNQMDIGQGSGINVFADTVAVHNDNLTLDFDGSNKLQVKAQGIGATQLADYGVTAIKLNSDIAGAGLTMDGGNALAISTDGSTIEINSDSIRVKDAGITPAKLAASVAGAGIVINGGSGALDVNVSNGLQITSDAVSILAADATLAVSAAGIKIAPLASGKVLIGSAGSVATAQDFTGDVTISANGVTTVNAATVLKFANYVPREIANNTGDNQSYSIASTPVVGTDLVFLNGQLKNPGIANDYTITANIIHFNDAQDATDVVVVSYFK